MIIEKIYSQDKESKGGKKYTSCNIQLEGKMYYGFGKKGITDNWKVGDDVNVELYIEEFEGKEYLKWKMPSNAKRIEELEHKVKMMSEFLRKLLKRLQDEGLM